MAEEMKDKYHIMLKDFLEAFDALIQHEPGEDEEEEFAKNNIRKKYDLSKSYNFLRMLYNSPEWSDEDSPLYGRGHVILELMQRVSCLRLQKVIKETVVKDGPLVAEEISLEQMLDDMISDSKKETETHRAKTKALSEPFDGMEVESYHSFYGEMSATLMQFLETIKSKRNDISSWDDLESFLKATESFWKTMRDQSYKIALKFAESQIKSGVDFEFHDGAYRCKMIKLYIEELNREMRDERVELGKGLVDLISGYSCHEEDIKQSIEWSE